MTKRASLLIRTKWSPPLPGPLVLQRERLNTVLDAALSSRLTLIVGPAGSGKTTLAAQWRLRLADQGVDIAWYNLSPDDNELWPAYLIASLEAAGLAVSDEITSLSQLYNERSLEVLLALLINAIYSHPNPLYLFLEDLQFISSLPAHHFIQRLIDLAPDNFHLVISSRQRPLLNLLDIGVKGRLTQIDFSDLRLSSEEQAGVLAQHGIKWLSGLQQRRLYELTDGWAAGLQMSALSLQNSGDFERNFQGWCGATMVLDERGINAYLDDCITRTLEADQIDAMLRMSICQRINRELCVVITGSQKYAGLIDLLIEKNLFLLPIDSDDATPWYRFHRMFSGYLSQRRKQLPEAELHRINDIASRWYAQHDLYIEAIRHAREAGNLSSSVNLLTQVAHALIGRAHFAQLLQLVDTIPREAWRDRIDLLLPVAWAEICCNRLADFNQTLDLITRHADVASPQNRVELHLLRAMKFARLDDTAAALALLQPLLDQPASGKKFHLLMLYTLAAMCLLRVGQGDEVRKLVQTAQRTLAQGHGPRPFLDTIQGYSFFVEGDLTRARHELTASLMQISRAPWLADEAGLSIKSTLALTCYLLDDFDAAEDYLEECIAVADLLGTSDCILYSHLAQSRLYCAAGMDAAAQATLSRLDEIAQRHGLDRLLAWSYAEQIHIACQRVDLILAHERMRRLTALARHYDQAADCAWADIALACAMAEVDLAMADGDVSQAAATALKWKQVCQQKNRMLEASVLGVRAAIALFASEQIAPAQQQLLQTLTVASQFGLNRLFADEGAAGLKLLQRLSTSSDLSQLQSQYVQRNLHSTQALPEPAPASGTRQDILSPRELEIVLLLARALSTKSIARELQLAPGTVKWHLKNIFSKLSAFSREDALSKARVLGLVN